MNTTKNKSLLLVAGFSAFSVFALSMLTAFALPASPTRYLHVRVSNPATHELVRVNVPLTLAEKVIPAINHGQLRDGKVQIGNFRADDVNIHAILDALKTAPVTWDEALLDRWLIDTESVVPDNDMDFHVPKADERADIIAFLRVSSGK